MDNLINKKPNSILETDVMKIDRNVIKIRDRAFQINNISSVSVYDKEKLKYPEWAVFVFIIGIVAFFVNVVIGFIAVVIGGSVLWTIYSENSKVVKKLTIWMNNGEGYSLSSENIEFLYKVADAIEYCMNNNNGYCQIDFKANDITNCNFAIGNHTSVR